jgi:hypothetical protein
MTITNSNIIDASTINTHTPTTIFLRNQKNWNDTRTKAFSYIPTIQKVLDLSLNFLSLFWIGSISSTVWQCCSWDQINLMLYPSHRWQPWGYLRWKNILILLQKVSDSRRQRASNIIKQNQSRLHIKA